MLDDAVAFAEYEAGNMDASAVPSADLDRVKADPVLSAELVTCPGHVHLLLWLQHHRSGCQ